MGTPDSTNAVWKLNVKMGVAVFTWDDPIIACRRRRPRLSQRRVAYTASVGVYDACVRYAEESDAGLWARSFAPIERREGCCANRPVIDGQRDVAVEHHARAVGRIERGARGGAQTVQRSHLMYIDNTAVCYVEHH